MARLALAATRASLPDRPHDAAALDARIRGDERRAGLAMLRGRTRGELAGADFVIAPMMGESGWMRPTKIPSFAAAGEEALHEALPELRRLIG